MSRVESVGKTGAFSAILKKLSAVGHADKTGEASAASKNFFRENRMSAAGRRKALPRRAGRRPGLPGRLLAGLLGLLLCFGGFPFAVSALPFDVSAASALLMEAGSGKILYAKDADTRRPMASTTKIMTGLLVAENLDLSQTLRIPKAAVGVEGSSVYLYENEELTVEDLLYALLLESANDAAVALALELSGSVEAFAMRMNARAQELGLDGTAYENPHGLDGEGHYTTARDLAKLTAFALTNESFRAAVSTAKKVIPMNNGEGKRLLINHNRLLTSYPGAIGVKTGYTQRSGRCLVTAAERDGVLLVAVTLNAPDDWRDHTRLLDYGFANWEIARFEPEPLDDIQLLGGVYPTLPITCEGSQAVVKKGSAAKLTSQLTLPETVSAPIAAGDEVGRLEYLLDGEVVASLAIVAAEDRERIGYGEVLSRFLRALTLAG